MNGFLPNPLDWMKLLVDAQRAQIDVAQKMIEAGTTALDPARLDEARQQLEEAGQEAIKATETLAKAQWEWLNLWRC